MSGGRIVTTADTSANEHANSDGDKACGRHGDRYRDSDSTGSGNRDADRYRNSHTGNGDGSRDARASDVHDEADPILAVCRQSNQLCCGPFASRVRYLVRIVDACHDGV